MDHKESWVPKIWCFWTVVLERILESPLDCKEIKPVNLQGNQSWISIGKTDAEGEAPILWPPDEKKWLIGKDWYWERVMPGEVMTVDEMVGCHHRLDGHGFGWTLGVGDGQGGLVCCSSWGHKESDMTEWVNWTNFSDRNLDMDSVISILTPQEWSDSIPRSQKQWVLVLSLKFPQFLHWTQSFLTTQGHLGWNYNLCFMRELKFFIKFWKKNQRFLQNKSP